MLGGMLVLPDMLRHVLRPAIALVFAGGLSAATLEYLSLEQMARKSTLIVRGRVSSTATLQRGSVLYTLSQVEVLERWKGGPLSRVAVAVPGGVSAGVRQTFSGAPKLVEGREYLFFLWAGRSGLNQVMGLSQGVFDIERGTQGAYALRAPSSETMLDSAGRTVQDEAVRMPLADLKALVERALAAEK
jgi:hypothetical protein